MATWAYTSGSWSRVQMILGAVNPGSAGFMVSSRKRSRPTRSMIQRHSLAVRWSFHMMQGRNTRPWASSSTMPCIWPVRPMPASSVLSTPVERRTWRMEPTVACHQSSGSCSAHSGRGVYMGYSTVALPTTRPSESISSVLAPVVPMSMPMRNAMLILR